MKESNRRVILHILKGDPTVTEEEKARIELAIIGNEPFLTVTELAGILSVSKQTIFRWIKRGLGKSGTRVGTQWRFQLSKVIAFQKELRHGNTKEAK